MTTTTEKVPAVGRGSGIVHDGQVMVMDGRRHAITVPCNNNLRGLRPAPAGSPITCKRCLRIAAQREATAREGALMRATYGG